MLLRKAIPLSLALLATAALGVARTAPKKPTKPAATKPATKTTTQAKPVSKSSTTAKKPGALGSTGNKSATHSTSTPHSTSGKTHHASKSKSSRHQPGQKAPTSDRVTEIQQALAKNGSMATEPNGRWDDSTVDAMKKFQSAHGLNPSGKLDARTLQKLGLGSQTAGVAEPMPPAGAVSRLNSPAPSERRQ
ncbi:MAG TPA: peptidoglycan-binding domain-containing protein [Candidatus Acidoferrum sp.]